MEEQFTSLSDRFYVQSEEERDAEGDTYVSNLPNYRKTISTTCEVKCLKLKTILYY